ncbi:uncharacterized protein BJ212DRAFT_1376889 [Suillus subaureus]|uniref:VWFA domain-containing protein n=1 Tax=Suillus subaureus TaxID=48587 RepID=A0A9P7E525_9AGAM|nr:uncharacterized protein BJ212DRAFT_1376889 [Suillus subaureus]KAG1810938.1 hypothetical protein BJ212DRAFT_1376889 [Suillus subaureus]
MTYQSKPTSNGVYRIKVLNQDLFIESASGNNPGLKLALPSPTSNTQKWTLTRVSGQNNVWTIVSVEDGYGVTHKKTAKTYWGYGYPYPQNGPSLNWFILERTSDGQTFSKIKLSGKSSCFDSCDPGSDAVHFYYDHTHVYDFPKQCFVFELVPNPSVPLDIMFLQDATGSQQPYINTARSGITQICNTLLAGGKFTPQDLRFGLIAFRDHPPQDLSFIIQEYPFTSDVGSFTSNLGGLTAMGGGDEPESQSDALSAAYKADWKDEATKVVVLITDSPPHGIGEDGDNFPDGCPLQIDPLRVATQMGKAGITLYVIACEPSLGQAYKRARDFYQGLVKKTGGKVVNLGDLSVLPTLIAGSALEAVDSEIYVAKYQAEVRSMANDQKMSASEILLKLHKNFAAAGIQHTTLVVDNMYKQRTQGDRNADIWFNAENLNEAKHNIQEVEGSRIIEKYQTPGAEQSATVEMQPISLAQVETVVQKCLMREL